MGVGGAREGGVSTRRASARRAADVGIGVGGGVGGGPTHFLLDRARVSNHSYSQQLAHSSVPPANSTAHTSEQKAKETRRSTHASSKKKKRRASASDEARVRAAAAGAGAEVVPGGVRTAAIRVRIRSWWWRRGERDTRVSPTLQKTPLLFLWSPPSPDSRWSFTPSTRKHPALTARHRSTPPPPTSHKRLPKPKNKTDGSPAPAPAPRPRPRPPALRSCAGGQAPRTPCTPPPRPPSPCRPTSRWACPACRPP